MKTSSSQPALTLTSNATAGRPGEIRSYAELQEKIHNDLRVQHPEWIQPDGGCPTCESYEQRLAELLGLSQAAPRNLVTA
jgi:hypothetical protein